MLNPSGSPTAHNEAPTPQTHAADNLAYERGDQAAIEKAIEEFGQDPELVVGEDIGSRIVKTLRRNAQLRRRLDQIQQEIDALRQSEISQLKRNIEEAEAKGDDPLGDLARQLMQELSARKVRLEAMREQAG